MKHIRSCTLLLLAAVLLLSGCVMRPAVTPNGFVEGLRQTEPTPDAEPEIVFHTVEFRQGDFALSVQSVEDGALPDIPGEGKDVRLIGWKNEAGERVDPTAPVTADTIYFADTRPLLAADSAWLQPREHGLLTPSGEFTHGDALQALHVLLAAPDALSDLTTGWDAEENASRALDRAEFSSLLYALFDTAEADAVIAEAFSQDGESVTRDKAAFCISRLLDAQPRSDFYYPDTLPGRWAYAELSAAAVPGELDPETLQAQTLDGFLWFDGYLYRLDEDGWFFLDEEYDGLYYGPDGRYTSGSTQLDAYAAKTIAELTTPEQTRRERLRAVYLHVKNDFKYLVRNYYESGAHGWEIPEAITLYETGKGNCYCYAGVFLSLARGLGYNAVAYSGTMGNQNQPHAWTEITLDGEVYICDPEIEMNYWWLAEMNNDNSMYTDNFMMLRRNAGGWNYQSVGRE